MLFLMGPIDHSTRAHVHTYTHTHTYTYTHTHTHTRIRIYTFSYWCTMSSHQVFTLDVTGVPKSLFCDVLRCLLHTILFQRAVGIVKPREMEPESLPGVTFVQNDDPELDAIVEEKLNLFNKALETTANMPEHVQIHVTFYERHVRKGLFGKSEERVVFEQWIVPIQLVHGTAAGGTLQGSALSGSASSSIHGLVVKRMLEVVKLADAKKDHLPPITVVEDEKGASYPFDITMPGIEQMLAQTQTASSDMSFFRRLVRGSAGAS
eukprot:ANDGO_04266.mRNA.1 Autophagy-related protein 101